MDEQLITGNVVVLYATIATVLCGVICTMALFIRKIMLRHEEKTEKLHREHRDEILQLMKRSNDVSEKVSTALINTNHSVDNNTESNERLGRKIEDFHTTLLRNFSNK
jgi:hypothetical protein